MNLAAESVVTFIQEYMVDQGHIAIIREIPKFYEDFKSEENELCLPELSKLNKSCFSGHHLVKVI